MNSHPGSTIHHVYRARHGLTDAARRILDRRLYAVLGTENDDGSVHVVPVLFLFDQDGGHILVETAAATRKARNIAARPRASLLVQTPEAAWVSCAGPAALVRGAEGTRLSDSIRAKYLTDQGLKDCGSVLAELDDVTIVLTPSRWLGWDMNALLETLAVRGANLDHTELWFQADQ